MYTYAFFKKPENSLTLLPGIAGDVQIIHCAQLSALVESDLDLEALQQDDNQLVQAVLTHDRMICELFWQTTILPLQFGTSFISLDALLLHLKSNQAAYLSKLDQLEGKAEYRLKLTPIEQPEILVPAMTKGKQYQTPPALQTQQKAELQTVLAAIAQIYPNYVLTEESSGVEKLYLLLDRQDEDNLYQRLQEWQDQSPCWQLMLGEALPPYHFV